MQIVYSRRRARQIQRVGSIREEVELELFKAVARQPLADGQANSTLAWTASPRAGSGVVVDHRDGDGTCVLLLRAGVSLYDRTLDR